MKLKIILIALILFLSAGSVLAEATLAQKLSGRILLQVQSAGEAWYVNPVDGGRYYLGRPIDAFNIMRQLGLGMSEADFNKLATDKNLINRVKGKIVLLVQSAGQAYYINPIDGQKYYLGRPADAFNIMKRLALGITDADLAQIPQGHLASVKPANSPATSADSGTPSLNQQSALAQAADAIRSNDAIKTKSYFTSNMQKTIEYTMNSLSSESKLLLANILSDAKLDSQTDIEKTYSATAYFSLGGYEVPLHFYVKKQADGKWLIANL